MSESQSLQERLARLQQIQQSLQLIMAEKQRMEMEFSETERAINEIKPLTDDSPIYKSIGSLLIKSDKTSITKELEEKKELLSTRISVLTRQEERTREKLKELQRSLQEELKTEEGTAPE